MAQARVRTQTHTQALNYKISIMQLSLRKEKGGKVKSYLEPQT